MNQVQRSWETPTSPGSGDAVLFHDSNGTDTLKHLPVPRTVSVSLRRW